MRRKKRTIMREAWDRARALSVEKGGRPSDYIAATMRWAWEISRSKKIKTRRFKTTLQAQRYILEQLGSTKSLQPCSGGTIITSLFGNKAYLKEDFSFGGCEVHYQA